MGIGPVFAVPRLLERFGLTMDQIDLWEVNEAFAAVVMKFLRDMDVPHDPGLMRAIFHVYDSTS